MIVTYTNEHGHHVGLNFKYVLAYYGYKAEVYPLMAENGGLKEQLALAVEFGGDSCHYLYFSTRKSLDEALQAIDHGLITKSRLIDLDEFLYPKRKGKN